MALAEGAGATVAVNIALVCDGKLAAAPRLLGKLGEPIAIAIGRTEKKADGSYVTVQGFRLKNMKVDKA